jgi:hypothetical protein
MTSTRWIPLLSAATVTTLALLGMGCSSSSPSEGGPDAAPHDSSVKPDTATDAPTAADHAVDAGHKDAEPDCGPIASAKDFKPVTYVPAVGNQGVCSPPEVADFVNACVGGTIADCTSWQTTNLAIDGGAGTPCGACILAPDNNGGLWIDPTGSFWPNWAGCIQLSDKTNGPACAATVNNIDGCVDTACDGICDTDTEYCGGTACPACSKELESTTCKSYETAAMTACAPAAAAVNTCTNTAGGQIPNYTYVITLICGGSATDAGHD